MHAWPCHAQTINSIYPKPQAEQGWPFLHNYTPEEYQAFDQNWSITQDSFGLMYFANGDGVLIYDGSTWELVPLPNKGMVRGVVYGFDNRVYVCGTNEIGYLEPNSFGKLAFHSLLDNRTDNNIGVVYSAINVEGKIYFMTKRKIIEWDGKDLKTHNFKSQITCVSNIEDKLVIAVYKEGLFQVEGDSFVKMTGIDLDRLRIRFVTKDGNGNLLLGSERNGLFTFNGESVHPFLSQQDEFFKEKYIRYGIKLQDSSYAIATLGGIIVLDQNGKSKLVLNQKDLLTSLKIYYLYQDINGLLWAAMDFGICKIEYPSRFSIIDQRAGLDGVVMNIKRHRNELFIATEYGLSKLSCDINNVPKVEPVYNLNNFVYDLISINNSLLFTTDQGLFNYQNKSVVKISSGSYNSFCLSKIDTNRILVSFNEGIKSMYEKDGKWFFEDPVENLKSPIYAIREMKNGDLWLETDINSVYHVSFKDPKSLEEPSVVTFSEDAGLPDAIGRLFTLSDELYYRVIYGEDVFKLDKNSMTFHLDTTISTLLNLQGKIVKVRVVDEQDNLWFDLYEDKDHPGFRMVAWKQVDGSYIVQNLQEERIYNLGGKLQYPEPDDRVVWYLGKKSILHHDLRIEPQILKPYPGSNSFSNLSE